MYTDGTSVTLLAGFLFAVMAKIEEADGKSSIRIEACGKWSREIVVDRNEAIAGGIFSVI